MGISKLKTNRDTSNPMRRRRISAGALRCRRKFLQFFPQGFRDETYMAWERDYKWKAHEQWEEALNRNAYSSLLRKAKFTEIAAHAVRIEARTNLLFSFEKMALRDAVNPRRARVCLRRGSMTSCTARGARSGSSGDGARP